MAPPMQKRKHPKYRKKKSQEEKKKMSLVVKDMEKKNFNKMLYSLPLDIKIKIFQMAVFANIVEWGGKEHKKNFKKTVEFINPNIYNSKTDSITIYEDSFLYPIYHKRFDNNGFMFSWYRESWTTCKDRRLGWSLQHNMYYLEKLEDIIDPEFKIRFNPLCQRKVQTKSQEGIKDLPLNRRRWTVLPEDIRAREWSNKFGYYWYHEKCRCRKCDRVRYLGYSNLTISDKEKFDKIEWEDDSKQWNPKSKIQLRYEKNIQRKKMREAKKEIEKNTGMLIDVNTFRGAIQKLIEQRYKN